MEGLAVIAIFIILIARTIKKHKAAIKASQEKYRPEDFGVPTEPQKTPAQQWMEEKHSPVQQKIDLDQAPMAPRVEHRHVEKAHTQTAGFAGEGDAARYHTREVSCETAGHVQAQSGGIKLPELKAESLASAVILSEILGKPKALRR